MVLWEPGSNCPGSSVRGCFHVLLSTRHGSFGARGAIIGRLPPPQRPRPVNRPSRLHSSRSPTRRTPPSRAAADRARGSAQLQPKRRHRGRGGRKGSRRAGVDPRRTGEVAAADGECEHRMAVPADDVRGSLGEALTKPGFGPLVRPRPFRRNDDRSRCGRAAEAPRSGRWLIVASEGSCSNGMGSARSMTASPSREDRTPSSRPSNRWTRKRRPMTRARTGRMAVGRFRRPARAFASRRQQNYR